MRFLLYYEHQREGESERENPNFKYISAFEIMRRLDCTQTWRGKPENVTP